MYGKQRVLYPMKRKGARGEGKWERISWDQATVRDRRQVHPARHRVRPRVHHLRDGHADDPEAGLVLGAVPLLQHHRDHLPGDLRRRGRPAGRRLHDARQRAARRQHGGGVQVQVLPGLGLQPGRHAHSRRALLLGGALQRHRGRHHHAGLQRLGDALLEVGEPEARHRHRAGDGHGPDDHRRPADRVGLRPRADRPAVPGAPRHAQVPARHAISAWPATARQHLLYLGRGDGQAGRGARPPAWSRSPAAPGAPPRGACASATCGPRSKAAGR